MKRGNQLRAAQDFKGALDAFRAADEIMHVTTTGFEVARSEVQLGQLVEALDMLMRVERIPEQPDEPQAFKEARVYARLLEADIGPRIPKIRFHVDAAEGGGWEGGVAVTVDGESVPIAAFDIPYAVDPGEHTVVASAADGRTAEQGVTVDEGEEREVLLTLPSEAPAQPPPSPHVVPAATARSARSDRRTLTWIAFGTAGIATLVGGAAGIASWAHESSASARCNGSQCPPSTYGDIDAAHTFATASTISFVVGGVAAVVGALSVLTATTWATKTPAPAARGATPWVGIGPTGVAGTF
jgi:hypothetical protein